MAGSAQRLGRPAVCGLAAGERERDRAAQPVCQGMDFGGASASADADRLVLPPPFSASSAAVRLDVCAVEQEFGRRTTCCGQFLEQLLPDASSTPSNEAVVECLARPVDRRCARLQRPPDFLTCTIPLIARRSSTRGHISVSLPCSGTSLAICASVSIQNPTSVSLDVFRSYISPSRFGNSFGPEPDLRPLAAGSPLPTTLRRLATSAAAVWRSDAVADFCIWLFTHQPAAPPVIGAARRPTRFDVPLSPSAMSQPITSVRRARDLMWWPCRSRRIWSRSMRTQREVVDIRCRARSRRPRRCRCGGIRCR